jgi:5-methylcytosine-specific restriction endonuclease McrA
MNPTVTPEDLIEFVRIKGKLQLATGKQQKTFTVGISGDGLEYVPSGTKKARSHEFKWLKRVCEKFSQSNSDRPSDYSELTVNASYTLALIRAYLDEKERSGYQTPIAAEVYERRFKAEIDRSANDSSETRRRRLAAACKIPIAALATTRIYLRNPDVVVEVLARANGHCEECNEPAPFVRKHNGTPYLEVHHKRQLADGGEDTVDNAMALCPNCHRREHYG